MIDRAPVLIIAAHPDDEVLGCGATMAKLAAAGYEVFIAILGEGVTSRYAAREAADQNLILELRKTAEKVKECLGAKKLFHFDFPDNRFDTVPLINIIKTIEGLIKEIKPQTVFTHHPSDLNIDHAITHKSVLTATRPFSGCPVKEIYAFEIPSSTEWSFGQFGSFQPDTFCNVESTLEMKIRAMGLYETERREFPHPRSPEAIEAIAQRWGSVAGLRYAEAFETIRRQV
jgi:LmbE family N-acetylglucosaminyl deacetylase